MSLPEFQRATAELVASPQRCLRARADFDTETRDYTLTDRERRRLRAILHDPAMSVNCALYRVNRMVPLLSTLPLTCRHLGATMKSELNEFWREHPDACPRFDVEARRFGVWLYRRVAEGARAPGPLLDALRFELAVFEATTAGGVRWVRFDHEPYGVLHPPASADPLPAPEWLLIETRDGA
jgi:hypothetical protein